MSSDAYNPVRDPDDEPDPFIKPVPQPKSPTTRKRRTIPKSPPRDGAIVKIGAGRFKCESASHPGTFHTVDLASNPPSCSCPARVSPCRHIRQAWAAVGDETARRAILQPTRKLMAVVERGPEVRPEVRNAVIRTLQDRSEFGARWLDDAEGILG